MNHSCEPAARVDWAPAPGGGGPPALVATAVRRVAPGEPVTIAYADTTKPFPRRRDGLRVRYGFECDCPRCVRDGAAAEVARARTRRGAKRGRDDVDL